jgi:DNA-binding transcriptional MerR regulator
MRLYTTKQTADAAGTSSSSIRNYTRAWAEFLSPGANPPAGEQRQYTPEDVAVMATIAALRSRMATAEQIRDALESGERLELPPEPEPEEAPAESPNALMLYVQRVNSLENRVDTLTDRLIDAESRAARAEAELAILRQASTRPPTFWDRLFGRTNE